MKDKFKIFFSKKDVKIKELKDNLEKTQIMSKKYLEIVNKLKKNKEISEEDYNYISSNSGILQLKIMKLKPQFGVVHYKRPFGLGEIPDYEIISNFPHLLSDRRLLDEAFTLIPAIEGALSTYNNVVDGILKDNEKLKLLLDKNKKGKISWKILKEDKKTLYSISLIPLYISSLPLLFYPITFILGLVLNIVSVFFILLLSFLSKSD
ncbi:hypothetical protein LCGC14_0695460 [marine sediment metagenome]|uniref:Uncharacterized protein n=1 Tax=marine sediment metagenome TaxID=412755 RepID=A0A0F9QP29_9ZZZZ|nr:MAG: hypothetical protein Lokiarch_41820 [Candidatus Lokiarchaeum sp. GC14_75]HEC38639.1 hypothetical protein [bacterium]